MILFNEHNYKSSKPPKSSGVMSNTQPTTLCVTGMFLLFLFSLTLLFLNTRNPGITRHERALTRKYPCKESLKTVTYVNSCPKDKSSWEERAKLKNCGAVQRKCFTTNFVYHCILDEYGKGLVELCAESIEIIGRHCAEFSSGGMFVQEHYENTCKTCPYVYNSSHSYLYGECYELPDAVTYINSTTTSKPQTTHKRNENLTFGPTVKGESNVGFQISVSTYISFALGLCVLVLVGILCKKLKAERGGNLQQTGQNSKVESQEESEEWMLELKGHL